MIETVTLLVTLFQAYALLGLVFAIAFVFKGAARLDPDAVAGTLGFRILILPGAAALWPWLLVRWMRSGIRPRMSTEKRP